MTDHKHIAHARKQANRAAKKGDLAEAERWSKAAERAERAPPPAPPLASADEKERRAELRRRLMRFVAADQDIQRWERERDHYWAEFHTAINNGTPPPKPLRPHPCGPLGEAMEEEFMKNILIGPEPRG